MDAPICSGRSLFAEGFKLCMLTANGLSTLRKESLALIKGERHGTDSDWCVGTEVLADRPGHLGDRRLDVGGTDEAQSIATIRSAVERGVTLIDTAPVYGFGRSEEIRTVR